MDVMVIEDDARLRDLYALALRGAGHDVRTAASASAARKMLVIRPADLLVLDLDLGAESGLGVATLADYVNPECRVIVATGSGLFRGGELFAMLPSCAAVLRKPVDLGDLAALAEHHETQVRGKKSGDARSGRRRQDASWGLREERPMMPSVRGREETLHRSSERP